MEHKEFVEKYRKEEITYSIQEGIAERLIEGGLLNKSYVFAQRFWNFISSLSIIVGIILSFIVFWWIFVPGFIVGYMIYTAQKNATNQWVLRHVEQEESLYKFLVKYDLIHIKFL